MTTIFRRATAAPPVYKRIEGDIRTRVAQGRWAAGAMIPSRKGLAVEYGVDLRTVQRAIASLLTDGTLMAHPGRGTFVARQRDSAAAPRPRADNLPQTRLVIGVINQRIDAGSIAANAIYRAAQTALRRLSPDVRILTIDTYAADAGARHEADALNVIEHEGLSGALVRHSGDDSTVSQLRRIVEKGIPLVLIDHCPEGLTCDFVGGDDIFSAVEAVEHLLSLGHMRVGFLGPAQSASFSEDRLYGYRIALDRAAIARRADLEFRLPISEGSDPTRLKSDIGEIARSIREMPDPPTAIFAVNDTLAYQLVNALEEQGVSVPTSLSVVGFDDIDRYSPRPPFLTTMRPSFESIGEHAAELLLLRIRGRAGPACFRHTLLPAKLIDRRSCAKLSP